MLIGTANAESSPSASLNTPGDLLSIPIDVYQHRCGVMKRCMSGILFARPRQTASGLLSPAKVFVRLLKVSVMASLNRGW
jgi:hypothetical protein